MTDQSPYDRELTTEEVKALLEAFASITDVASKIMAMLTEALLPIAQAYNNLPDDVKKKIAQASVEAKMGHKL